MNKDQLALRVQEIIAGVEGVAGLYPARSAVFAGIASTLGADETLVAVDTAESGLVIRVRIAALTDTPAPQLVRDVAAAVRAKLGDDAGDARVSGDSGETRVSSVEITVCGFAEVPFP